MIVYIVTKFNNDIIRILFNMNLLIKDLIIIEFINSFIFLILKFKCISRIA